MGLRIMAQFVVMIQFGFAATSAGLGTALVPPSNRHVLPGGADNGKEETTWFTIASGSALLLPLTLSRDGIAFIVMSFTAQFEKSSVVHTAFDPTCKRVSRDLPDTLIVGQAAPRMLICRTTVLAMANVVTGHPGDS